MSEKTIVVESRDTFKNMSKRKQKSFTSRKFLWSSGIQQFAIQLLASVRAWNWYHLWVWPSGLRRHV